jgi:GT2 family glycosyltransferase
MTRDRRDQLLTSLPRHGAPLVVVDNGSTDGSLEAIGSCRPDAQLIGLGRNLGACARNLGVARARTPYVAFADDDSWWEPGALDRAVEVLDAHPAIAVLVASVLIGPEQRADPLNALLSDSPLPDRPDLPGRPVLGFLACAAVVRRDAFLAAGGFDDVVFFFGEETRLALDLATNGWALQHLPELVVHHHPVAGRPDNAGKPLLADRNSLLTAVMRRPWPVVSRTVLGLLRSPDRWPALGAAARRTPGALRRRRPVPAGVEAQLRLLEDSP